MQITTKSFLLIISCITSFSLFSVKAEEQAISFNPQALTNLMISVNPATTQSELVYAAETFKQQFTAHPDDRYAKLFYGYTQIFLATQFLEKKNYIQAAERAKTGFFYIDEAAEQSISTQSIPEQATSKQASSKQLLPKHANQQLDWQLRYLRLRMDAFIPESGGRCPIAISDLTALSDQFDSSLQFMLDIFATRLATTCQTTNAYLHSKLLNDQTALNKWNWPALLARYNSNLDKKNIIQQSQKFAPAWQPEELQTLFNQ